MNLTRQGPAHCTAANPDGLQTRGGSRDHGRAQILLADMFGLYLKTKNFHWHVSGPHFRDYHLLFDEQGQQIFAITDVIAERVRKIGGMTVRSIGEISRLQRIEDNDADYVTPLDMLAELRDDNKQLVAKMREAHELCARHNDVATTSLLEVWIDEAERRTWFLFEASRSAESAFNRGGASSAAHSAQPSRRPSPSARRAGRSRRTLPQPARRIRRNVASAAPSRCRLRPAQSLGTRGTQMSAQMIVELPSGAKIHFGQEPVTGLSEVGVAEDIAKITGEKFKAALGSLADLVAALEDSVGHMAHRPTRSKWSLAPRSAATATFGSSPAKARRTSKLMGYRKTGKMQQHRKARRALDQGADRRAAKAQDEVSFPVPWHCPVGCLSRTLADHDLRRDEAVAAPTCAGPRHPQHPPGSQASR